MIVPFALVPFVLLQAPLAPEAAPAPPAAPPVEAAAPLPASPAAAPAAVDPPDEAGGGFFAEGQPGHYLQWYGADYLAVAAVAVLGFSGAFNAVEPMPALIGPQVTLADPDLAVLLDERLNNQIGLPMVQEQIPELALAIGLGSVLLVNAGVDLAVRRDLHRTHNLVLGSAEAVLGAVLLTEGLKLGVGRLRPDFRDRYLRAACGGSIERPDSLDCSGVPDDGFVPSREDVLYGMKSFPSGHTATSFAALSFLTLSIGSEYLWGDDMPWWTQPLAGIAIGALTGGALYVAGTRFTDNRHHLEDILAGAGIGIATGTSSYLLHFDPGGNARRRGVAITPVPLDGGAGVAVTGSL